MARFRSFDNSTCNRVLDLLNAGYLRPGSVTVIKFGVNDGSGSGRGTGSQS